MRASATPSARQVARAAVVAGVLGGAPSTLHALVTGGDVLAATRAAGTLLPGRRYRPGVVAGAVAHGVVTVVWVGVLAAANRRRRIGPWRGALAGLGIAALDLGVIAPRRAPAIAALPQAPQWADHLAFGALVGACLSGQGGQASSERSSALRPTLRLGPGTGIPLGPGGARHG